MWKILNSKNLKFYEAFLFILKIFNALFIHLKKKKKKKNYSQKKKKIKRKKIHLNLFLMISL
jgi:hypothetical protein